MSLRPEIFGSSIAESAVPIGMRSFSLSIGFFPSGHHPTKKLLVVEFGRTVDPDSQGSSRDVGGSEVFAVAMALFGLALLCDGTLNGWSKKLFGARERNPEYTGSQCIA